jgi:hypothetical protein
VAELTRGLIDRQQAYEVILTYALVRCLRAELWGGDRDASARH